MLTSAEQIQLNNELHTVLAKYLASDTLVALTPLVIIMIEQFEFIIELDENSRYVPDEASCGPPPAAPARPPRTPSTMTRYGHANRADLP